MRELYRKYLFIRFQHLLSQQDNGGKKELTALLENSKSLQCIAEEVATHLYKLIKSQDSSLRTELERIFFLNNPKLIDAVTQKLTQQVVEGEKQNNPPQQYREEYRTMVEALKKQEEDSLLKAYIKYITKREDIKNKKMSNEEFIEKKFNTTVDQFCKFFNEVSINQPQSSSSGTQVQPTPRPTIHTDPLYCAIHTVPLHCDVTHFLSLYSSEKDEEKKKNMQSQFISKIQQIAGTQEGQLVVILRRLLPWFNREEYLKTKTAEELIPLLLNLCTDSGALKIAVQDAILYAQSDLKDPTQFPGSTKILFIFSNFLLEESLKKDKNSVGKKENFGRIIPLLRVCIEEMNTEINQKDSSPTISPEQTHAFFNKLLQLPNGHGAQILRNIAQGLSSREKNLNTHLLSLYDELSEPQLIELFEQPNTNSLLKTDLLLSFLKEHVPEYNSVFLPRLLPRYLKIKLSSFSSNSQPEAKAQEKEKEKLKTVLCEIKNPHFKQAINSLLDTGFPIDANTNPLCNNATLLINFIDFFPTIFQNRPDALIKNTIERLLKTYNHHLRHYCNLSKNNQNPPDLPAMENYITSIKENLDKLIVNITGKFGVDFLQSLLEEKEKLEKESKLNPEDNQKEVKGAKEVIKILSEPILKSPEKKWELISRLLKKDNLRRGGGDTREVFRKPEILWHYFFMSTRSFMPEVYQEIFKLPPEELGPILSTVLKKSQPYPEAQYPIDKALLLDRNRDKPPEDRFQKDKFRKILSLPKGGHIIEGLLEREKDREKKLYKIGLPPLYKDKTELYRSFFKALYLPNNQETLFPRTLPDSSLSFLARIKEEIAAAAKKCLSGLSDDKIKHFFTTVFQAPYGKQCSLSILGKLKELIKTRPFSTCFYEQLITVYGIENNLLGKGALSLEDIAKALFPSLQKSFFHRPTLTSTDTLSTNILSALQSSKKPSAKFAQIDKKMPLWSFIRQKIQPGKYEAPLKKTYSDTQTTQTISKINKETNNTNLSTTNQKPNEQTASDALTTSPPLSNTIMIQPKSLSLKNNGTENTIRYPQIITRPKRREQKHIDRIQSLLKKNSPVQQTESQNKNPASSELTLEHRKRLDLEQRLKDFSNHIGTLKTKIKEQEETIKKMKEKALKEERMEEITKAAEHQLRTYYNTLELLKEQDEYLNKELEELKKKSEPQQSKSQKKKVQPEENNDRSSENLQNQQTNQQTQENAKNKTEVNTLSQFTKPTTSSSQEKNNDNNPTNKTPLRAPTGLFSNNTNKTDTKKTQQQKAGKNKRNHKLTLGLNS